MTDSSVVPFKLSPNSLKVWSQAMSATTSFCCAELVVVDVVDVVIALIVKHCYLPVVVSTVYGGKGSFVHSLSLFVTQEVSFHHHGGRCEMR